jgi:hypothetical protein
MRRLVRNILVILLVSAPAACTHIEEYAAMAQHRTVSQAYRDVFDQWTREQTIYSQFETRAHIAATQKSRDFNQAYLAEYARIYLVGDHEKRTQEAVLTDQSSRSVDFVFYAYTPEKESNDFEQRDSIWKIFLVRGEGERLEPVDIKKIEEVTPVIRMLFPYVNPHYGNFYSIRFSQTEPIRSAGTGETVRQALIFASVLGSAELVWEGGD